MFCTHCGKIIADDSMFCEFCGARLINPNLFKKEETADPGTAETAAESSTNDQYVFTPDNPALQEPVHSEPIAEDIEDKEPSMSDQANSDQNTGTIPTGSIPAQDYTQTNEFSTPYAGTAYQQNQNTGNTGTIPTGSIPAQDFTQTNQFSTPYAGAVYQQNQNIGTIPTGSIPAQDYTQTNQFSTPYAGAVYQQNQNAGNTGAMQSGYYGQQYAMSEPRKKKKKSRAVPIIIGIVTGLLILLGVTGFLFRDRIISLIRPETQEAGELEPAETEPLLDDSAADEDDQNNTETISSSNTQQETSQPQSTIAKDDSTQEAEAEQTQQAEAIKKPENKTATVFIVTGADGNKIRVRTGPGINYPIIDGLWKYNGDQVTVYETYDADGYTWFRIGDSQWMAGNQSSFGVRYND